MQKLRFFGLMVILLTCGRVYATEAPPAAGKDRAPAAPAAATPATPATATPVAAPAPAATAPPVAAPSASLSGKWTSHLVDEVQIKQAGDKVTGTYQYKEDDEDVTYDGKFEGTLKDKTIRAQWWERPKVGSGEESRGDLEWKLAEDGKMLTGWYREEGDKEKQDWNLYRK